MASDSRLTHTGQTGFVPTRYSDGDLLISSGHYLGLIENSHFALWPWGTP
ncbi:MAG: hypothetical protein ACJA0M_002468 [Chitinophagales bacterium]|jgi:hypothetical protein